MAKAGKNSLYLSLSLVSGLFVALVVALVAFQQPKDLQNSAAKNTKTLTGNGAPGGPYYNLNIIGVPKDKQASITNSSGNKVFVPLVGNCDINLTEGDFGVIDHNCANDNQSSFSLPNPDSDNDGETEYSIYARILGKPDGSSKTTTCTSDPTTGDEYCSVYSMVSIRGGGKNIFENVSEELLYVYVDLDGDGTVERYNLFSDALQDYFWSYDSNGLKLVQLRFYEITTEVE